MTSPGMYAKAIVGALVAALGALTAGLADGTLTLVEGLTAASAGLAAFGAVYGTRNSTSDENPEAGQADLLLLVAILVGVVLLLFGISFR